MEMSRHLALSLANLVSEQIITKLRREKAERHYLPSVKSGKMALLKLYIIYNLR
jgi:hypothetical protein